MKSKSGHKRVEQKKAGFPLWTIGIVVLVVAIGAGILLSQPGAAAPARPATLPAEVSVQQAAQMQKDGAFLLDVREPSEWNEAHVPGATLVPLGQLSSRLSEVPKDKPVVVICRSGNRSAQARDLLLNSGFTSVTSVAGGINDWKAKGLPTVSGP